MRKKKTSSKTIIYKILLILFLGFALTSKFSASWYISIYGDLGFLSILFTLLSGLESAESGLISNYLLNALAPALLLTASISIMLFFVFERIGKRRKWKMTASSVISLILSTVLFINAASQVKLTDYIHGFIHRTKIYEEEYVSTKNTKITFPANKRNLIYIYLESMETSYFSKDLGGGLDYNVIPELYNLAKNNVNFSNNDDVGGFYKLPNTTWTIAAMVAQSSGIPLSTPIGANDYENYEKFLPGVTTLNDILHDNGYYQTLMIGSDAAFAGRNKFFNQHGIDRICDLYTAREDKVIPNDYSVWWGYEDLHLFEYAKRELLSAANGNQPFAFTILTADTHHIGGYVCSKCRNKYSEQYENVLACSSSQVNEFINWLKKQSFYNNTTIVICGDHLSMDNEFFERNYDEEYVRHVYDCIINPALMSDNTKNRVFSALDMFPTTLAAMGCRIEGDRLGLGVNLFSDVPTLCEKLTYEKFSDEIGRYSSSYLNMFVKDDD